MDVATGKPYKGAWSSGKDEATCQDQGKSASDSHLSTGLMDRKLAFCLPGFGGNARALGEAADVTRRS